MGERSASPALKLLVVLSALVLVGVLTLIVLVVRGRGSQVGPEPRVEQPIPIPRLEQVYQVGRKYRSRITAEAEGQGFVKKLMTNTELRLRYRSEATVVRTIRSNGGGRMEYDLRFERARTVECAAPVDAVALDLGIAGELVLRKLDQLIGGAIKTPGSWATGAVGALSAAANTEGARRLWSDVAAGQLSGVKAVVNRLEGKTIRATYVNGEGVVGPVSVLVPSGGALTPEEDAVVRGMSAVSDLRVFENPDAKVGAIWTVEAADLLPFLDSGTNGTLSGKVRVERAADAEEGRVARIVVASAPRSRAKYFGRNGDANLAGTWEPEGEWRFRLREGYIERAELTGEIEASSDSKDFWIFDAKMSAAPKYRVAYECEIVP